MASRTRLANEAWEALFRAQATIGRELAAADVWDELSPREYGVLYALSQRARTACGSPSSASDVLLTQPGMSRLDRPARGRGPRRARRRPRRRARLPHPPHRGRRGAPSAASACATAATSRRP